MIRIQFSSKLDPFNERGFATPEQALAVAQALKDRGEAKPVDGIIRIDEAAPGTFNSPIVPPANYRPYEVSWVESTPNSDPGANKLTKNALNAGQTYLRLITNPAGRFYRDTENTVQGYI